jgi:serine/threonine-protein kinase
LGDKHPGVAASLNGMARTLIAQRRHGEAAEALRNALDIARPALGSNHQLVAIYAINLGAVQLARKQAAEAEALLREGLRVRLLAPGIVPSRRRMFVEDDWSIAATKSLLGAALVALHRYQDAEDALLDAQRNLESMPAPPREDLTVTLNRLIELYDAWQKPERAAVYRAQLAGYRG